MDGCTFVWLVVEIAGIIFMTMSGLASVKRVDGEIVFTSFANFGICVLVPVALSIIVSIFFGISMGTTESVSIFVSILAGIPVFFVSELVLFAAYFWAMFQQLRYYEKKYQQSHRDDHLPQ